jgi:predicted GIY-YIG superfamily endonuclease
MSYCLSIPYNFKVTYILKLEDDCWYVGITKNGKVNQRLANHLNYGASGWTKVHKPVSVYKVVEGDREEEITKKLIAKYGADKVRGWHYVQIHNPSFDGLSSDGVHGCLTTEAPVVQDVSTLFT